MMMTSDFRCNQRWEIQRPAGGVLYIIISTECMMVQWKGGMLMITGAAVQISRPARDSHNGHTSETLSGNLSDEIGTATIHFFV